MTSETPARHRFDQELEQLRFQVEIMAVRVDQNLERMREVLRSGDLVVASSAIRADDVIDAMHVSLMEHCYELLRREAPVASDLRFVVSALRVLSELERIGDLSLRVDKVATEHQAISGHPVVFNVLLEMADDALERFRLALRAWSTLDLGVAVEVATMDRQMDRAFAQLMAELQQLQGTDAASTALVCFAVGRALERIADHASIIGARVRYLVTGDPGHLAAEIR